MKAEKGAHCVIWSPNLGKEWGEEEGKTVPPQSLWRPCGDPGGRGIRVKGAAVVQSQGLGSGPLPSASPHPTPTPSGLVPHSRVVLSLLPGHSFCHLGNLSVLRENLSHRVWEFHSFKFFSLYLHQK